MQQRCIVTIDEEKKHNLRDLKQKTCARINMATEFSEKSEKINQ